jgi:chromosome segregation ATPase
MHNFDELNQLFLEIEMIQQKPSLLQAIQDLHRDLKNFQLPKTVDQEQLEKRAMLAEQEMAKQKLLAKEAQQRISELEANLFDWQSRVHELTDEVSEQQADRGQIDALLDELKLAQDQATEAKFVAANVRQKMKQVAEQYSELELKSKTEREFLEQKLQTTQVLCERYQSYLNELRDQSEKQNAQLYQLQEQCESLLVSQNQMQEQFEISRKVIQELNQQVDDEVYQNQLLAEANERLQTETVEYQSQIVQLNEANQQLEKQLEYKQEHSKELQDQLAYTETKLNKLQQLLKDALK